MSKTRIIESIKRLDVESARRLLDANPSLLTVTDRNGHNLLHLACSASAGNLHASDTSAVRLAQLLLDRGLDPESSVGRDAGTPLFFAVQRARNLRLVKALISRGAQPANAPGGGLFAAAWWGDRDIIKILLGAGANIDIVVGVTPFLASWCWQRFEGAKALTEYGANVNYQDPKNGKTALYYGVEKEFDPTLLKWLVKHGASPDIADHDGVSPKRKALRKRDKRFAAAIS